MKENSTIIDNSQTENNSHLDIQTEVKIDTKDRKSESEYLKMFCKDISKINNRDECGWTPLYRTVVSGILEATELLLNNGADPNIQSSIGETPLYQAVEMEKVSHVNLLLKKGANPNISQIDGLSPLHLAVNRQNILIIKELLKYNADPNNKTTLYEQTPLHFAIKNNVDPMILLILVQYNGSLIIKDKFGKRPLDYVTSEEMKKVIEKLKLESSEDTLKRKGKQYDTPKKDIKLSENNVLPDSLDKDSYDKENKINFNQNVVLKEPGNNWNRFYRVKSGNISNDISNIRKHLFENRYNKKIFNKSFYNYNNSKDNNEKKENEKLNLINGNNNNHIKKEIFNKIKKDLIKNYLNSKKENVNTTNKKIPHNYFITYKKESELEHYATMQCDDDEKSVSSQKSFFGEYISKKRKSLNIPILPSKNIRYSNLTNNKNSYMLSDKTNKSTCLNSENGNSTNSKNGSNCKKRENDFNTISEVKKFTLIPRDSRNTKLLSQYFSQKKINQTEKSLKDFKTLNISDSNNSSTKNLSSININKSKNRSNKLYIKPKISMNEASWIDKNKSAYTFNIINNNTVNNKNFFNSSNRTPKAINTSTNSSNIVKNEKEKGPLKIRQFKLQKKVLSMKNLSIPFDKKKALYYYNRNTYNTNSNTNTYNSNTFNSINNDSFCDSCSQFYISKKNSNVSSSVYDSIIIEPEKYPIYDWLNDINLSCYSSLFIHKKIYDFKKIISGMKKGKIKLTPKDIYKIGIRVPGHIYRIFVKLELDSGLIDKKILEIIENKKSGRNEEINILNNSIYNICGCCSLKERSKSTCRKIKENIYEIEQWLININMIKYKKNFIENGFDKFEYFFLQMFGSFPIDSNILKNSIGIENEKDRDLILLQLQKDVKYLSFKSKNERNLSNPKIIKTNETNSTKNDKKESSQECKIF